MSCRPRKQYTLVLIRETNKLLLGYKKRGFGEGRWNGFGGKVEAGETITEGAVRELKEESGINVTEESVHKVADLEFTFDGQDILMHVHVFLVQSFTGTPVETEEMRPQWFPVDKLPYSLMWPDDSLWVPVVLRGGKVRGTVHFQDHDNIHSHHIEEVNTLA